MQTGEPCQVFFSGCRCVEGEAEVEQGPVVPGKKELDKEVKAGQEESAGVKVGERLTRMVYQR